jgi:hypothetical protein
VIIVDEVVVVLFLRIVNCYDYAHCILRTTERHEDPPARTYEATINVFSKFSNDRANFSGVYLHVCRIQRRNSHQNSDPKRGASLNHLSVCPACGGVAAPSVATLGIVVAI